MNSYLIGVRTKRGRKMGIAKIACWIAYIVMGLVQIAALMEALHHFFGFWKFFAFLGAAFLSYIPLVGSILGMLAAKQVWHWPWWQAIALFMWMPLLFLCTSGLAGFLSLFARKPSAPSPTIDTEPAISHPAYDARQAPFSEPSPKVSLPLDVEHAAEQLDEPQEQVSFKPAEPAQQVPPQKKTTFILVRLFAGELPLWAAYWIGGVVMGILFNLSQELVFSRRALLVFGHSGYPVFLYIYFFLYVFYFAISQIGIWRSATNYEGRFWRWAPLLAKGSIGLGWIFGIPAFVEYYHQIRKIAGFIQNL